MTGPEHYVKAEKLLRQANSIPDGFPGDQFAQAIAEAQVHATLAGVYAHNRAQTELMGLLHLMLDQIREAREAAAS